MGGGAANTTPPLYNPRNVCSNPRATKSLPLPVPVLVEEYKDEEKTTEEAGKLKVGISGRQGCGDLFAPVKPERNLRCSDL